MKDAQFFYVENGINGFALVKATEQEIIDTFIESVPTPTGIGLKYTYNESDKLIYVCLSGKYVPTSNYQYEEEEAKKLLLETALERSQYDLLFLPTNNPNQLILEIKDFMEKSLDSDEDELFSALEKILVELSNLS